jgi:hypothetical protein
MTVLIFHRSLYSEAAMHTAVEAYRGLAASIEVVERDQEFAVTFTDPDPDVPDLLDAFANHVLFETAAARST